MQHDIGGDPKRHLIRWTLFLIVVLGAALRLHHLGERSIWYDEGATLEAATFVDRALTFMRPDKTSEAPLFVLATHVWRRLIDVSTRLTPGTYAYDSALRLLPCLLGIAAIPLVFATCKRFFKGARTALLAAFLFAVSPFQIAYAQELRPYTLHVLLGLGVLWCFLKAIEEDRLVFWGGFVVLLALSVWNHFYALWILAAIDLYLLLTFKDHRRILGKLIAVHALVLLLSLPPLWLAFRLSQVVSGIETPWVPPPDLKTPFITFKNFFAGYSPETSFYWPLFLFAAVFFGIGLYAARKDPKRLLLLFILVVVPIAASAALWRLHGFSFYEHRLFILCGAIACLVVAHGICALKRPATIGVAVAAFSALTAPCLLDYYAQRIHPLPAHRLGLRYKVDNRGAAHEIATNLAEGDVVGHAGHVTLVPFRYYLPGTGVALRFTQDERLGFLRAFPNEALWANAGLIPVPIETASKDARRFWYVESWWEPATPPITFLFFRTWLDEHFIREVRSDFDGVTLYRYRKPAENWLPTSEQRLDDYGREVPPQSLDLGLRLDSDRVVSHSDRVEYAFTVVNGADQTRNVLCRIYESAAALHPLAFTRQDPEADVWRPALRYDLGPPPGVFNTLAMVARLPGDAPKDAGIAKDVRLEKGRYTVHAHLLVLADRPNRSRAALRFTIHPVSEAQQASDIGYIHTNEPDTRPGWAWRTVGILESDGEPFRLVVSAENPDDLPSAYADFAGVTFVPVGKDPVTDDFEVALDPKERKTVVRSTLRDTPAGKRIDIELFDPATRQFRAIFFHPPHQER